jgi:hypothetical protein
MKEVLEFHFWGLVTCCQVYNQFELTWVIVAELIPFEKYAICAMQQTNFLTNVVTIKFLNSQILVLISQTLAFSSHVSCVENCRWELSRCFKSGEFKSPKWEVFYHLKPSTRFTFSSLVSVHLFLFWLNAIFEWNTQAPSHSRARDLKLAIFRSLILGSWQDFIQSFYWDLDQSSAPNRLSKCKALTLKVTHQSGNDTKKRRIDDKPKEHSWQDKEHFRVWAPQTESSKLFT